MQDWACGADLGCEESVAEPLPASAGMPDEVCAKFWGAEAGVDTELSLEIGSVSRLVGMAILCGSSILGSSMV